jgi:hypothetical protein
VQHCLVGSEMCIRDSGNSGGAGGSGIVILKYADTFPDITSIAGGLTFTRTTFTGFKCYTFTAGTGTVTF